MSSVPFCLVKVNAHSDGKSNKRRENPAHAQIVEGDKLPSKRFDVCKKNSAGNHARKGAQEIQGGGHQGEAGGNGIDQRAFVKELDRKSVV